MKNAQGVGVEQLQLYVAFEDTRVAIFTATHLPGKVFKTYESVFMKAFEGIQGPDGARWLSSAS
jgi:hypothetical protein